MDIVDPDLKDINTTWEVAEELAVDKEGWHQCVAQSNHQDA